MKKIIIFDFNRTIYDPDKNCLVPFTKFVLRTLIRRGFTLCLISQATPSRKNLIKDLSIEQYFSAIVITENKSTKDFENIINQQSADRNASFIVGDRARKEIAMGNSIGLQTIWIKAGKFAQELPLNKKQHPTYTAKTLKDILRIINQ